jgi:pimeloyl-ACP methyl ester carboxylesterase
MRVVFLPGLLCDGEVFAAQADALARHVKVAVADFAAAATIEEMAKAALAVFEGPLVLIGFSMGGRAAMEAARLAPRRVVRLCLIGTGFATASEAETRERQVALDLVQREGIAALARDWTAAAVAPELRGDPSLIGRLRAMIARADAARLARHTAALLTRPDAYPALPRIACPTLVIAGDRDPWVPFDVQSALAATIPGARFVVAEGCGHFVPMERPDTVTRTLIEWLGLA